MTEKELKKRLKKMNFDTLDKNDMVDLINKIKVKAKSETSDNIISATV